MAAAQVLCSASFEAETRDLLLGRGNFHIAALTHGKQARSYSNSQQFDVPPVLSEAWTELFHWEMCARYCHRRDMIRGW